MPSIIYSHFAVTSDTATALLWYGSLTFAGVAVLILPFAASAALTRHHFKLLIIMSTLLGVAAILFSLTVIQAASTYQF